MGQLENRIKTELKELIQQKSKDKIRIDILKLIISEFQRKPNPHEEITDKEVVSILTKMVKSEKEMMTYKNQKESDFVNILSEYIPKTMSEDEIRNWIKENMPEVFEIPVDRRLMVMRDIMMGLGTRAKGNDVKSVILS